MPAQAVTKLGPFLGVNNRLPETQLHVGRRDLRGDYLRNAVNVDVTDSGTVVRRDGYALAHVGTDVHSLWGNGNFGLYVDYDVLYMLTPTGSTQLHTGLTPGRRMAYAEVGGYVIMTNGVDFLRLTDGAVVDHTIRRPNFSLTAQAGSGSLPSGVYQVLVTYVTAEGEESGASDAVQIEVPANSSIVISGFQGAPSRATALRVYMTTTNGDTFYRYDDFAIGTTSLTIFVSVTDDSMHCQTRFLDAMPAGTSVAVYNGRIFTAQGNCLLYSLPYSSHLYDPYTGFICLEHPITLIQPVGSGLFIVADKTWFLQGDVANGQLVEKLPFGAASGSAIALPDRQSVMWYSDRGLVMADDGGEVKLVHDDNALTPAAQHGAVFLRETDGRKHAVASVRNASQSAAVATSFMDADIVRQGDMQ